MKAKGQQADIHGDIEGQEDQGADQGTQQVLDNLAAFDESEAVDSGIADAVAGEGAAADDRKKTEQDRQQAAQFGALMAVGFCEKMVTMRLPHVQIGDDDRGKLVDSLAPILAKNGGGMPAWLVPYADELKFGMTLAGVAFGVWMQHQAHAAEVARAATEKARHESARPAGADAMAPVGTVAVSTAGADPLDPSAVE